jgi:type II secretory ATPase GspE/PulE/Tfp pilus assembly ATPase PilB-like protein
VHADPATDAEVRIDRDRFVEFAGGLHWFMICGKYNTMHGQRAQETTMQLQLEGQEVFLYSKNLPDKQEKRMKMNLLRSADGSVKSVTRYLM